MTFRATNDLACVELPFTVEVLAGLRYSAQLAATHYSTQIEGNRLTQAQVAEALAGAHFPERERDEAEVRNYYLALEYVESLAPAAPVGEEELRTIHGLVMTGKATPTLYRGGQNVIRDAASGGIVYTPPEAGDVPSLTADLFTWVNKQLENHVLPAPIVAATCPGSPSCGCTNRNPVLCSRLSYKGKNLNHQA